MSLFQIEKILLQQAGSGSLIRKITCPCMLKLDYTSASVLGTRLLPFPNQIFLWWFSTSCRVTACSAASPEQRRGEGWSRMWEKRSGPIWKPACDLRVGFCAWACMGCCLGLVPWEISAHTGSSNASRDCWAFRLLFTVSDAVLFLEDSDP